MTEFWQFHSALSDQKNSDFCASTCICIQALSDLCGGQILKTCELEPDSERLIVSLHIHGDGGVLETNGVTILKYAFLSYVLLP